VVRRAGSPVEDVAVHGAPEGVGGQVVPAPVADERHAAGEGVERSLQARGHGAGRGRQAGARAGACEVEEVDPLGLVELQCPGDGVEHAVRGAVDVAALELGVVVDADRGEVGDLLAAQAGTRRGASGATSTPALSGVTFARRDTRNSRTSLRRSTHGMLRRGVLAAPPTGRATALRSRHDGDDAPRSHRDHDDRPRRRRAGRGHPAAAARIERRAIGPKDVRIDVRFCGICHSDIHFARGEWGEIPYPAVPGHEITGVVTEVGSEVEHYRAGDRVGVGCMVDSCRECENCAQGEEQYCLAGNTQTYGSIDRDGTITYGGYSDHVVVDEDFVLRIPDGMDLDAAAPLLCAGITTYSPLRHWGAGPGKRVGIVGSAASGTWPSSWPGRWAPR
jgi:hypothetical protein